MSAESCCGHPIALADCGCPDCWCGVAAQDAMALDFPMPASLGVEPVDLDSLEEATE